jgi:zinc protease
MKLSGILTVVSLCVAATVSAAPKKPAAKTAPKVKLTAAQVLDRALAAQGGKAAYERMSNVLMDGTIELPALGVKGTVEMRGKAPNKSLALYRFPQTGESRYCYDGTEAWAWSATGGLRTISGPEKVMLAHAANLRGPAEWRKLYTKVEMVGIRKVGDRSAYVVREHYPGHAPFVCYYDSKTFLMSRMDTVTAMEAAKNVPLVTHLLDYRDVDGIKWPFRTVSRAGKNLITELRINNLLTNVAMKDELFVKPESPATAAQ